MGVIRTPFPEIRVPSLPVDLEEGSSERLPPDCEGRIRIAARDGVGPSWAEVVPVRNSSGAAFQVGKMVSVGVIPSGGKCLEKCTTDVDR